MAYSVYIIYSATADRYYVGATINAEERLHQHNSGYYTGSSTKIAKDWTLFLTIECETRAQALQLERFIKRMKSRSFYFKLKDNPELVNDLLKRFSL